MDGEGPCRQQYSDESRGTVCMWMLLSGEVVVSMRGHMIVVERHAIAGEGKNTQFETAKLKEHCDCRAVK